MDIAEIDEALQSIYVQAALRTIRFCEGTAGDGYRMMFGGKLFDSFADHPRVATKFTLAGKQLTSTAAGAYQFLSRTWDEAKNALGLTDFSPINQDRAAVWLIWRRKALDQILNGDFEGAIRKLNLEWASLPGSPYGQPVKTLEAVMAEFSKWVVARPAPLPVSVPSAEAAPQAEQPKAMAASTPDPAKQSSSGGFMSAFLWPAISALANILPQVGKLFSSGSEVAERNVAAATMIVDAAKNAVGARNEQELIETIQTGHPETVKDIQEAVKAVWHEVTNDFSGIEAARKAANDSTALMFWKTGPFYVTLAMIPLIYFVVIYVIRVEYFSAEIKSMVIGAIISGVLNGIMGFWMGTNFSSQRKSEIIQSATSGK